MLMYRVKRSFLFVMFLFVYSNVLALSWAELKAQIDVKYKDFSNEVKDIEIVMETETKGVEGAGPSEIKMLMKGEKYRMETKMDMPGEASMPSGMTEMKNTIIFDGKDLWSINPFTGKQKLPAEANVSNKNQMNWWKNMPENGKILGSEKVGDRDCYIVEIETEDNSKMKVWIDKKASLLVKMEYEGEEGKSFKVINSNFKKVKNWEMPYTTEVFIDGEMMSKSTIKSFEVNKGLSDELFDADKISEKGNINIQDMMKEFKKGE